MTIVSDRLQHAAQHPNPKKTNSNGASFAKQIEAGYSARKVMEERALSFSETGLLGLHYAHKLSCKSSNHADWQDSQIAAPKSAGNNAILAPCEFENQSLGILTEYRIIPLQEPFGQHTALNATAAVKRELAISPPTFVPNTLDFDHKLDQFKSVILESLQRAILRARPETKFTLKILETSQGISIVCEGDLLSECDMQEFTDLAHQIANDYSVTVCYLVVKSGNNL